ncbi:MAG TPA: ABC-type transport auxiliary lipoprotein family protein [Geminicoccaceae bacterium]|nr:ABC-type transport auxiliary lipoprotein family protein [Geminicoccus sp.]HMU50355.1 ABC-type transport auxiliary lipoprotein family protein [Geminicoccaceae bacterium]
MTGFARTLARRRLLAALPPLVGVASCTAADLIANRPAPKLFELSPKSTFPPDLPQSRSTVRVESVTATAGLNSTRIALRPSPTELDYYAGALWIDVVPVMVQNLLVESLENSGRVDALGPAAAGVPATFAMLAHVREFQAEYAQGSAVPSVRVRLQARLVTLPRRESVDAAGAEADIPAQSGSIDAVVMAFDEALGTVLKQIVGWTARTLHAIETSEAARRGRRPAG